MASFLNFTALSTVPAVNDLGDAIRNTANSTLTLLYTLAIMIWGFTLNRTRAWRTDGGTAAFGALALVLGVSGTAVNFLEVKEDRMRWLPGVVECVLLWQSWMGFWWWVGAGMWTGEAEDVERKERRASRKEEKRRRRRETAAALVAAVTPSASASARTFGSARRRAHAAEEEIEMDDLRPSLLHPDTAQEDRPVPHRADSNESVSSGSTPPLVPHVLDPILHFVRPFLARLRLAHDRAVVEGAAQPPGLPDHVRRGWGIRALMMRGRRERGERRAGGGRGEGSGGEVGAGERRAGFEGDGGEQLEEWEDDSEASDDERVSGPSRAEEERPGASCFRPLPYAFLTSILLFHRCRDGAGLAWSRHGRRAVVDLARRHRTSALEGRSALLKAEPPHSVVLGFVFCMLLSCAALTEVGLCFRKCLSGGNPA